MQGIFSAWTNHFFKLRVSCPPSLPPPILAICHCGWSHSLSPPSLPPCAAAFNITSLGQYPSHFSFSFLLLQFTSQYFTILHNIDLHCFVWGQYFVANLRTFWHTISRPQKGVGVQKITNIMYGLLLSCLFLCVFTGFRCTYPKTNSQVWGFA